MLNKIMSHRRLTLGLVCLCSITIKVILCACFLFCILAGVVVAGDAVVVVRVQAVLVVVHLAGASVVGVGLDSSSNVI